MSIMMPKEERKGYFNDYYDNHKELILVIIMIFIKRKGRLALENITPLTKNK